MVKEGCASCIQHTPREREEGLTAQEERETFGKTMVERIPEEESTSICTTHGPQGVLAAAAALLTQHQKQQQQGSGSGVVEPSAGQQSKYSKVAAVSGWGGEPHTVCLPGRLVGCV